MATFRSKLIKDPGSMASLGPVTKVRPTNNKLPLSPTSNPFLIADQPTFTIQSHTQQIREKTDRSIPMSHGSRYGSPSDYFSETESSHSRTTRSRLGGATSVVTPTSRPSSRLGSDIGAPMEAHNSRYSYQPPSNQR